MATQVEDIKWLPSNQDRRFMVDGFGFKSKKCQTYFLTHFHSDHTIGLPKHFHLGKIYTSEVTAQLLLHDMGLQPATCVVPIPLHAPILVEGCRVTLVDAGHCPGAVMVLVEVLQGRRHAGPHLILHTGDCRWVDGMAAQVLRASGGRSIDTIFLDTTYCVPRYTFPPQELVLDALAREVQAELAQQPATLLVVGSYHIGKEKVYLGLARRLGLKVWVSPLKLRTLQLLQLPAEDMARLTTDPAAAQLHVSHWGLKPETLRQRYLQPQGAGWQAATRPPPEAPARAPCTAPLLSTSPAATPLGGSTPALALGAAGQVLPARDACVSGGQARWACSGLPLQPGTGGMDLTARLQQGQHVQLGCEGGRVQGDGGAELPACQGVAPLGGAGSQQGGAADLVAVKEEPLDAEEAAELAAEQAAAAAVHGRWRQVLGVRATGWSYRKRGSLISRWLDDPGSAPVLILGAPYSEHSSWPELVACVSCLRPRKLIPTVNAGTPQASQRLVDRLAPWMDLRSDRSRIDAYVTRTGAAAAVSSCDSMPMAWPRASSQAAAGQGSEAGLGELQPGPAHQRAAHMSIRRNQAGSAAWHADAAVIELLDSDSDSAGGAGPLHSCGCAGQAKHIHADRPACVLEDHAVGTAAALCARRPRASPASLEHTNHTLDQTAVAAACQSLQPSPAAVELNCGRASAACGLPGGLVPDVAEQQRLWDEIQAERRRLSNEQPGGGSRPGARVRQHQACEQAAKQRAAAVPMLPQPAARKRKQEQAHQDGVASARPVRGISQFLRRPSIVDAVGPRQASLDVSQLV